MATPQSVSQSYEDTILRRDHRRWLANRDPEAWAQYRHAAAQTLRWFDDVQSGFCPTRKDKNHEYYSPTQYVRGMLVGEFVGINSYFDAEVIITSIHNVMPELSGEAIRRHEAAENTRADNRLVGCLIEKGATKFITVNTTTVGNRTKRSPESEQSFFPCPMPGNQNCWILGFYIITDLWKTAVQPTDGKANQPVTMVRLERWQLQDKAWFASDAADHDPPSLMDRDFTSKAPEETCATCQKTSPRMFEEFFLCRDPKCADFWKHNGEFIWRELTYTKPYLQQREDRFTYMHKPYGAYKGDKTFPDLPEMAEDFQAWYQEHYKAVENDPVTAQNFKARMTDLNRGFLCPYCGMMNRRLQWTKWKCANQECEHTWPGQPPVVSAADIVEIGKTPPQDWSKIKGHTLSQDSNDGYMRHHYDLRHGCGVTIIVPKAGTNALPRKSDWLWDQFQQLANTGTVQLHKQFVQSRSPGMVTSHFIHNFGMKYNLALDLREQTEFKDAPAELIYARDSANKLCQRYQPNPGREDFNQCYVAAYFADQHMSWHDDGEAGLGSTIATWTLGGEGEMWIGPTVDQYWGRKADKTHVDDDLVLVGVKREVERRALKEALEVKLAANPPLSTDERKAVMVQYWVDFMAIFEIDEKRDKRPDNAGMKQALKIPLTHGSIVVMHGEKMQSYYKHTVNVNTPLRFALTFRHITDENSKVKVRKLGEHPHVPDRSYIEKFTVVEESDDEQPGPSKRPRKKGDDGHSQPGPSKRRRKDSDDEDDDGQSGPSKRRRLAGNGSASTSGAKKTQGTTTKGRAPRAKNATTGPVTRSRAKNTT